MINQTKKQVGEAYAFFNCSASKDEIERELLGIRNAMNTPNQLELSLTEVNGLKNSDTYPDLLDFIEKTVVGSVYPSKDEHLIGTREPTKIKDLKYALHGRYRDKTDENVVSCLSEVVNGVYMNFDYGETFTGTIVRKDSDGEYII